MIDFEKMKECIFKPKINIKYIFKIEKIYNSILYRHKKQFFFGKNGKILDIKRFKN